MRRFLAVLVAIAGLAALGADSASAWPIDPAGYQTMNPYTQPGGSCSFHPYFDSAHPIRLRYGWGTLQPAQLNNFLGTQSGQVDLFNVNDPANPVPVYSDHWGVGDQTGWEAPTSLTLQNSQGRTFQGVGSRKHDAFGVLAPGEYSLNVRLSIAQTVQDGFDIYKAGDWVNTVGCAFTVQ